jgi:acetyltransferase-like isoleucine patch superfamily enzyme
VIGAANALRQRARFALWVAWLRLQLRRRGARLEVSRAGVVRFGRAPRVRVLELGDGERVTRLRFGEGVSLGDGMSLDVWAGGSNLLEVGDGAYFLAGARVELRGGTIAVGRHAHVRDGAVLKSEGMLSVGREVTVSFHDVLACTERIEIGDLCGLGERVTITDSDHTHDGSSHHYLRRPLRVSPVKIGRNVLVSANAVILRGATIGDNAVVAAGAVVGAGEHEGGHVYAGAPAIAVKRLSD